MGYYSTLTAEAEKGTTVEPFIVTEYQTLPDGSKPDCWFGWEGVSVDERGNIEEPASDYYQKWYNDDLFVQLLASRMKSGRITLHFEGEDYSRWGYVVEPDAVVEFADCVQDLVNYSGSKGKDLFRRLLDEASEHYQRKSEELQQKKLSLDEDQNAA
ncbi:hypothetical protein [Alcanivorax sp.]|uniref:hypothetical protein n=1 Tax=Alcanivorax sp. TaxID=1872427 RepID=UPI00258B823E|nr:hypothetical protein [Alcanivorax sp.]